MEAIRYDLIHTIERKYGSISNCYDDDPLLRKLQNCYEGFKKRGLLTPEKKLIIAYLKRGYSTVEIKSMGIASESYASHIASVYHIKIRNRFRFLIKDTVETYVVTQKNLYSVLHIGKYLHGIHRYQLLHPGRLTEIDLRWEQVPDGAQYVICGKTYVKHGINSYLED